MLDSIGYFRTNDQLNLYFTSTQSDASKTSIVFVHGLGEHIGRYDLAFQAFSNQGFNCFGYDQRGFGRSEGARGQVNSFSNYVDDLATFIDSIVRKETNQALFLLGHSMGSIVALEYALKYRAALNGLLLFSCPITLMSNVAKVAGWLAQGLSVVLPTFKVPNLIDPAALSNNEDNIKAFMSDPYAVNQVSLSWLREFTLARMDVLNRAQQITLPVLMNHGEMDTIEELCGAKALLERLGSEDKTLYSYPGLKHELLNHCPNERAIVLQRTFAWLNQQLQLIAGFSSQVKMA